MSPIKNESGSIGAKIALVYDRVNTARGGAEQVLIALHRQFPDAPLYCGLKNLNKAKWAQGIDVRASFLSKFPGLANHHRRLAAILPVALETLDLSEFDIVISITSAECKAVLTKPHQLHITYLLTPPRYLYSHYQSQLQSLPWIVRPLAKRALSYLRWWDQVAMTRPDVIIPISELISGRLKEYYPDLNLINEKEWLAKKPGQLLTVPLTPPAEDFSDSYEDFSELPTPSQQIITNHFGSMPKKYLLQFGRLVEYKRNDLTIKAAIKLGQNLIVVGGGPDADRLHQLARGQQNICFLPHLDRASLGFLVKRASACLFPALEDFGISALECALSGTMVITHQQSGVVEALPKDLSVTIKQETLIELERAITRALKTKPQTDIMTRSGSKYDTLSFQASFEQLVTKYWSNHE